MNSEELNAAVYNKMNREQAIYLDWLESLPPHEILQHAYEYTVRQDILLAMEYMELQLEQCEALLRSKDIIGDVLSDFNKIETGYMDIIRDCIEGRADKMIRLEAQREEAR